jgi:GTP-binding protein LepA
VDFAYEVSRSLAACEGSILVVDAVAGCGGPDAGQRLPGDRGDNEIVPGPEQDRPAGGEPERVRAQIEDVIGIERSEAVLCSAKSGLGIEDVLEAVVTRLPAPKGDEEAPAQGPARGRWYDPYLGVVVLVRVFDGRLRAASACA